MCAPNLDRSDMTFCHSDRSGGISKYSSPMPREYDFWVYIMTNKLDSVLYIGMTNDLTRRVSEHQSGKIPGFTADYRCHKLVYCERYSNVDEAIEREKQLKRWSRKKKIGLIESI